MPERSKAGELEGSSVGPAQEQKIGFRTAPEGNVGEVRGESRENHPKIGRCKRICLQPLNKFPPRSELPADRERREPCVPGELIERNEPDAGALGGIEKSGYRSAPCRCW